MAIALGDPFMAGVPVRRPGDFKRNSQGTPSVSDPCGALTKPKNKKDPGHVKWLSYDRPSGFGKQIEDMYSIMKWAERQEALGFAIDPFLIDQAKALLVDDIDTKEWRDAADKVVAAAKRAAKAGIAAERGTHAHELTEDDDQDRDILARIEAGEELGLEERVQHNLVDAWRAMLKRDGLEIIAVEAAVVHDGYRMAGTLDRLARLTKPLRFTLVTGEIVEIPAGAVIVLDIKSGKRGRNPNGTAKYWQSYAVQVAVYAGAVPYDTETDTRGEWPFAIDQRWAVIAHLDVLGAIDGNPTCDLVLVDIEAGRRAADLCVAAKAWATEATVFSIAQLEVEGDAACSREPASSSTPLVSVETDPGNGSVSEPSAVPISTGTSFDDYVITPPSCLAIVDARATLSTNPDQGADLTEGFDELWDAVRAEYQALDPAARSWIAELSAKATRQNLTFHTVNCRTERSYHIARGLVALTTAGGDQEELLRALLALVVGDVALFVGVHPGHVLGSLGADEAQRWAELVDVFNGPGLAAWIDHDSVFRLRELAPA